MTTICIQKTVNGEYKSFTCNGHSDFARNGKDIVCAAISILVINTINSMEELTGEEMDINIDEKEGFIDCKFCRELSTEGKLLMDSMVFGVSNVEKQYGKKYLMLKFKEV